MSQVPTIEVAINDEIQPNTQVNTKLTNLEISIPLIEIFLHTQQMKYLLVVQDLLMNNLQEVDQRLNYLKNEIKQQKNNVYEIHSILKDINVLPEL